MLSRLRIRRVPAPRSTPVESANVLVRSLHVETDFAKLVSYGTSSSLFPPYDNRNGRKWSVGLNVHFRFGTNIERQPKSTRRHFVRWTSTRSYTDSSDLIVSSKVINEKLLPRSFMERRPFSTLPRPAVGKAFFFFFLLRTIVMALPW